jgi:hypothetical protein
MTDEPTETPLAAPAVEPATAAEPAPPGGETHNRSLASNKVFWAGVGIGSAALVAALMYARRPKKNPRDI